MCQQAKRPWVQPSDPAPTCRGPSGKTVCFYTVLIATEPNSHAKMALCPNSVSSPCHLLNYCCLSLTKKNFKNQAFSYDNTRSLSAEPQENSMKVVLYYFYHYCRAYQHCVLVSYVCVFLFPLDFGFLKSKAVICSYLHFHTSRHFQHVEV